jgi:hypothetical protein
MEIVFRLAYRAVNTEETSLAEHHFAEGSIVPNRRQHDRADAQAEA